MANRSKKLTLWLAAFFIAGAAALAGCAEDTGQEDIGEGPVEPQPDVGPTEEAVAPETEEEIGTADDAGVGEDEAEV